MGPIHPRFQNIDMISAGFGEQPWLDGVQFRSLGWRGGPMSQQPLTAREKQCLELAAQRLSDQEIADRLGISRRTVAAHFQSIFGKLGVRDRRRAAERVGIQYLGAAIPISGSPVSHPDDGAEAVNDLVTTRREGTPSSVGWSIPPAPERLVLRLALVAAFAIGGTVLAVGGAAILHLGMELMQQAAPAGAR
jgi:DNA-binding CsgD family transcriptional regulator